MSELINRQAALDTIQQRADRIDSVYSAFWEGLIIAQDIVKNIPSAEPERKKGRWERRKGSDCWECSQCHAVLENDDLGMHNFYFCYHCGANMMNKSGYMDIEEVHYE